MIRYKIEYIQKGKIKTVFIKADSLSSALKIFKKQYKGIIKNITEIEEKSFFEKIKEKISINTFTLDELIAVFEQLYVMIGAGISIDTALYQTVKGIKNKKLKQIFEDIYNRINSGFSLYNSFKTYEKQLGNIVISMISLGEESGDLANALKELSLILTEISENRKRFKKATRYPLFIIFAMIIAFTIVIIFVIPPFKAIFAQMGGELPLPTKFLLWIEGAVVHYGWMILTFSIIFFIILNYLYNNYTKVKLFFDKIFLKIYILGKVIKLAMIGRFIFVFKSLLQSGIPIVDAFDVSISIVDNSFLKKRLLFIKDEIIKGGSISKGFEDTKMFEPMIIQMIKAGEESGNLTQMFGKISDYYLKEYRYIVDNIAVLIEPILILAIAGFVFTLALGVFLPMWNLTETMK